MNVISGSKNQENAGAIIARPAAAPASVNSPRNAWAMSGRDFLHVVFRRSRLAFTTAGIVMLLCTLAAIILPNKYRSEAKLFVRVGRETVGIDPGAKLNAGTVPMETREREINSELELLRNRRIVERVVATMGPMRVLGQDVPRPKSPVERTDDVFTSAIVKLEKAMSIEAIPDTVVLSVSCEAKSKELAQEITREYVNTYLQERAGTFRSAGSDVFFQKQIEETRVKLASIESEIRKLQEQTGITAPEAQRTNLQNRIENFQRDIDATKASLVTTEASIVSIEARLKAIPERVASETAMSSIDKLRQTLAELTLKEKDMASRFKDDFPELVVMRSQIDETRKMIADAENGKGSSMARNPAWDQLNQRMEQEIASRDSYKARVESLLKEKLQAEKGQALIEDTDVKIRELKDRRTIAEESLKDYARAYEQARSDKELGTSGIGNVSISQPPTLPFKPVSPNRPLIILFGLFAAIALGVGLALFVDGMDHTVHRPEDLAKIGIVRCVSVPYVEGYSDTAGDIPMLRPMRSGNGSDRPSVWQAATRSLKTATGSTLRLLGLPGPTPEIVSVPANLVVTRKASLAGAQQTTRESPEALRVRAAKRHVAVSDALLTAGHSIFERLLGNAAHIRNIAVVGGHPGEGSSAVALHLATAMSLRLEANTAGSSGDGLLRDAKQQVIGQALHVDTCDRVLLVDANIHDASLHRMTSLTRSPGLGNWLGISSNDPAELSQFVKQTAIANLDVLTAGAPKDADMLSVRFSTLLSLVRPHYRFVVVDMPCLWQTESTARLAGLCHGVLLVAEADRVRTEAAQQAISRIEDAGGKMLGVVLNKRRYPVPDWIYTRS